MTLDNRIQNVVGEELAKVLSEDSVKRLKANLEKLEQDNLRMFAEELPNEVWKDIPDFEGYYQISDLGRLRSLPRIVNGTFRVKYKILAIKPNSRGYVKTTLFKDKVPHYFSLHRLVLLAFKGKSNLSVNHINMVKSDNRLSNLEYMSSEDNSREAAKLRRDSFYSPLLGAARRNRGLGNFESEITLNKKSFYLGTYKTDEEASKVYHKYLKLWKETGETPPNNVSGHKTSDELFIGFHQASNKWRVRYLDKDKVEYYLGLFLTEGTAIYYRDLAVRFYNIYGKLDAKSFRNKYSQGMIKNRN